MIAVLTGEQSRLADQAASEALGLPSYALMELASKGLAEAVMARFARQAAAGVVVVCGPGNNGGDGFGCARWLHRWGVPVSTWALTDASSGDAALAREAARRAGVPTCEGLGRAGLIVDAVFGTGLSRPVQGAYAQALLRMDTHPAPVVAADLPSGLCADTGRVLGESLVAQHTVMFGAARRGAYAGEGPARCGSLTVVDLGFGEPQAGHARLSEASAVALRWPRRAATAHKGSSGRLLVIAGSEPMAGAAHLCCLGALAAGAGLVTLLTSRGALTRLGALPPEVMVRVAGEGPVVELGRVRDLDAFDAVVAGPGLGGGAPLPPHTEMALAGLWASHPGAVVFDADALCAVQGQPRGARVVTPHPGEAGRMLRRSVAEVQADRFGAVEALAGLAGVSGVALLKGHRTLVAPRGGATWVNPTGGPALATGGTGDVLAGMVGALLARGVSAADAAMCGAYAHGLAGDALPEHGARASDVAAAVPGAVSRLLAGACAPDLS